MLMKWVLDQILWTCGNSRLCHMCNLFQPWLPCSWHRSFLPPFLGCFLLRSMAFKSVLAQATFLVIDSKRCYKYKAECDGTQNIFRYWYRCFFLGHFFPVPVLFNETNFLWYRYRYYPKSGKFPGIIWYRYQIHGNFPVPVANSREFSGTGTKFFLYWFRYFFWDQIFSVPVPSKKEQNSRDREFPGPGCMFLNSSRARV